MSRSFHTDLVVDHVTGYSTGEENIPCDSEEEEPPALVEFQRRKRGYVESASTPNRFHTEQDEELVVVLKEIPKTINHLVQRVGSIETNIETSG